MKHVNPKPLVALLAVCVFGAGGWYVDSQRNKKRSLLSGYFESRPTQVSSRVAGRVAQILVEEGEPVKSGQTLIELEATPARQETEAKLAAVHQAQERLRELQNGPRPADIQRQEAVVAEAEANLLKLRNGARSEEIAVARARLRQAEAQYRKATAGPRPQEIAQVRAVERNALARLRQAERGLTSEERAQVKARLDAAMAHETLASKEVERTEFLFREGAISRQQKDRAETDLRQAEARRKEMEEAYRRAEAGTPVEEMEQARQAHLQAKAVLELTLAGTRKEDIESARAEVAATRQALMTLLRGSRTEDIEAAEAKVAQTKAALAELRAGIRPEQVAQAKAALRSAQASAQSSQATVSERTIRSARNGVVERVLIAVGDLVSAGTPVIRMDNPKDIWLRIYVPEAHLAKVTVGSDTLLRVDGISESLTATVESVATQGEFTPANLQTPDERGKQVFAVRLRLKRPDARVKAGMYATVLRLGSWEL